MQSAELRTIEESLDESLRRDGENHLSAHRLNKVALTKGQTGDGSRYNLTDPRRAPNKHETGFGLCYFPPTTLDFEILAT